MPRAKKQPVQDPATEQFLHGLHAVFEHPLFEPFNWYTTVVRNDAGVCPANAWAVVHPSGTIYVHPKRRGSADEWAYVIAHCVLHLGFEHCEQQREQPWAWNLACDVIVDRMLRTLKFGRPPSEYVSPLDTPGAHEDALYATFCQQQVGPYPNADLRYEGAARGGVTWAKLLGYGLAAAVESAVDVAGGKRAQLTSYTTRITHAEAARRWFINSYPLLGALAAAFKIIEDPRVCQQHGITVAAVDIEGGEIFMNPAANLNEAECRFVMAHELLHVGLRHDVRCEGRDPYLWNVACDYVINAWLVQLGVGQLPAIGALYDASLVGESAEAVYDRIVTDVRRYRRLATLRGVGLGDILAPRSPDWWTRGQGTELDRFYRECLGQGLDYHRATGRGLLPAGLEEEIRALSQPPVPWDVELARWFDRYFAPIEQQRTYARASRRQAATPDIPRPSLTVDPRLLEGRTFGVVLDTSGSMNREILGQALGAIASYSISHDVPAARVIFCDAAAYDAGYIPPDAIAGRVRVKGRGGTVLQPGIDLLQAAPDFPEKGPILIITDGQCDKLQIRRDHAFLMPAAARLPFVPRGPVFRIDH